MPTVRVFLTCVAPPNQTNADFDTFISVTPAELRRGEHIEEAIWRAETIGYRGPFAVTEVRRLDAPLPSPDEIRAALGQAIDPRQQRWIAAVDAHQATEGVLPARMQRPYRHRRRRLRR